MTASMTSTLNWLNSLSEEEIALQAPNLIHLNKIKEFFNYTYNPDFTFDLPEGDVPFTAFRGPEAQGQLFNALRTFYIYNKGAAPGLGQIGKQAKFISMLEGIDKDDAALVCYIKEHKKLPREKLTKEFLERIFPDLAYAWHYSENLAKEQAGNVVEETTTIQKTTVTPPPQTVTKVTKVVKQA